MDQSLPSTRKLSRNYNVRFDYAKPYAPWQKGAVENANMLIRQYVPKGFNIKHHVNTVFWHIYRTKLIVDQGKKFKF